MSPRTAQQNQTLRAERRAEILESALVLFARFGYERTSVRMIAQEAGTSQGLMYNYFAGKEELLRALFLRGMEDVQQAFASAEETAEPRQRLEQIIRTSFALVQQNMRYWQLFYGVRMQPTVVAGLAEEIQAGADTIRQTFEAHFRELGAANPAIQAALLFALIDGVSQQYTLDPDGYPLAAVISEVIATFCGTDT